LHKKHSGIAATRNLGLRTARYSHVTFLDSDDEITLERLRTATSYSNDIVIGRQQVIFDVVSPPPGGVPDPRTTDGSPTPYLTSIVAPAITVLDIEGFRESIALSDDLDLVMRLRLHGATIRFDDAVFVIRHVTGSNASLEYGLLNKEYFQILRDLRQPASGKPNQGSQ
jgi:glycosyltransferase involved in cell wall biosynthesis